MSLIEQLGQKVDERLATQGLVLTQGGEPTYVPLRPDQPEWNTEALGPEKFPAARRLGQALVRSLFAGAVAVKLQGKQYPGEVLPRWALALYRRREGAPLWKNPEHLLWGQPPLRRPTPETPQRVLAGLARALGIATIPPQPVYDDVITWLWRNHPDRAAGLRIPVRRASHLLQPTAPIDCSQLAGWESVSQPAGWVLPLDFVRGHWVSEEWNIPGESEITLLDGDSPIGLRLPLVRLPPEARRRAMTAEVRNGELLLFLPPCPDFGSFAALVGTLEAVITDLRLPPVALEGYPPPFDPDWECLSLTSDPGVLEVNLPPAESFAQLTHCLRTLHHAALRTGLCGRKLAFNGRRVGTGGGAHILFGGPSLETNPFVKRPHLLASLIRFLLAHPSLSYGFSGLYLGPSSQAPRADETVPGMLDELEIALTALDSITGSADPAFIDRLLRSLLLDWNGNTHRAEVCVDKFCNPFAPNGRLGVVEFRAIAMLPDVEDSLAVNLLFRALLTAFSEEPFRGRLKRWTDAERGQFLLPEAVRDDLGRVLAHLHARGIEYPLSLLEPSHEFRFPLLHFREDEGGRFEIRQALDFWCAMGEAGGGTSRRVDATTDRVQVSLEGPGVGNAAIVVNGWQVPLHRSERGLAYAGVRYQAFTNDYGLHPHLKSHAPLLFELIDRDTGTVRYACEYSPWKLDGGHYPGMPKDEADARARLEGRSRPVAARIGKKVRPKVQDPPPAGKTLDLRVAWELSKEDTARTSANA